MYDSHPCLQYFIDHNCIFSAFDQGTHLFDRKEVLPASWHQKVCSEIAETGAFFLLYLYEDGQNPIEIKKILHAGERNALSIKIAAKMQYQSDEIEETVRPEHCKNDCTLIAFTREESRFRHWHPRIGTCNWAMRLMLLEKKLISRKFMGREL